MRHALALALAVCLSFTASTGHAAGALSDARAAFDFGNYEEARRLAEGLLERNVLGREDDLIEAHRITALSYFYSEEPDRIPKAEHYFLGLLSIEPDYRLDPFFTPPAAVEFLDQLRTLHEPQLRPIREERQRAREAKRAEEEARQRFREEQARAAAERATEVRVVERRHLPLVFLPFGAGQFQNGEVNRGLALASIQLAGGLGSVVSYFAIEQLRGASGGFSPDNLELARGLDVAKWTSSAIFYAAWIYGIADAWSEFVPETVRIVPSAAPEAPRAEGPARAGVTPFVAPVEQGAQLGLTLRF